MKTDSVVPQDLSRSVLAVPPLARTGSLMLDRVQNERIIRHLAAGGVTTLMYGGNANLYNLSAGEMPELATMLIEFAGDQTWIIPSVGADYGKACDQIDLLRDFPFPTVMLLPLSFPATPPGVAIGIRRLAERYGKPLIAYVKFEGYLEARDAAALIADGAVAAVKYAVVRENPREDAYLAELVERAGPDRIISGIGERPVIDHFTAFGLKAFTSGSVCVAPALSTAILRALTAGDVARAGELRELFIPLEDLRDRHSPLRILHEAVRLAGIADTGPMLPFLDNISDEGLLSEIERAARELLRHNEAHLQTLAAAE
jgi:4-hydroxy-tetrahydrodipicolinate synthase